MGGKSWAEKMKGAKAPHVAVLERPMAGLKPGARLFIASPLLVERYVRSIPRGQTRDAVTMRAELARQHRADATCPMSTGIFVRIVAEAALEAMDAGEGPDTIAPFWRLVEPDSAAARKLSCGPDFIRTRREMERA